MLQNEGIKVNRARSFINTKLVRSIQIGRENEKMHQRLQSIQGRKIKSKQSMEMTRSTGSTLQP